MTLALEQAGMEGSRNLCGEALAAKGRFSMEFNIVDLAKSINGYFGAAGPTGCVGIRLSVPGRPHFWTLSRHDAICPWFRVRGSKFHADGSPSRFELRRALLLPKVVVGEGAAQVVIGAALAFEGLLLQPLRERAPVSQFESKGIIWVLWLQGCRGEAGGTSLISEELLVDCSSASGQGLPKVPSTFHLRVLLFSVCKK